MFKKIAAEHRIRRSISKTFENVWYLTLKHLNISGGVSSDCRTAVDSNLTAAPNRIDELAKACTQIENGGRAIDVTLQRHAA